MNKKTKIYNLTFVLLITLLMCFTSCGQTICKNRPELALVNFGREINFVSDIYSTCLRAANNGGLTKNDIDQIGSLKITSFINMLKSIGSINKWTKTIKAIGIELEQIKSDDEDEQVELAEFSKECSIIGADNIGGTMWNMAFSMKELEDAENNAKIANDNIVSKLKNKINTVEVKTLCKSGVLDAAEKKEFLNLYIGSIIKAIKVKTGTKIYNKFYSNDDKIRRELEKDMQKMFPEIKDIWNKKTKK